MMKQTQSMIASPRRSSFVVGRAKTFSNDTLVLIIRRSLDDDTSRPSSAHGIWTLEISGLAEDDAPADYHLSHASWTMFFFVWEDYCDNIRRLQTGETTLRPVRDRVSILQRRTCVVWYIENNRSVRAIRCQERSTVMMFSSVLLRILCRDAL
jgi:hypothetical protein